MTLLCFSALLYVKSPELHTCLRQTSCTFHVLSYDIELITVIYDLGYGPYIIVISLEPMDNPGLNITRITHTLPEYYPEYFELPISTDDRSVVLAANSQYKYIVSVNGKTVGDDGCHINLGYPPAEFDSFYCSVHRIKYKALDVPQ